MIIKLSPINWDQKLTVVKNGDKFTINGEEFDFTPLADGSFLPQSAVNSVFIIDDVKRIGGELSFTLLLPHGSEASEAVRFPAPLLNPPDGKLEFPT